MEMILSEIYSIVSAFMGILLAVVVLTKMKGRKAIRVSLAFFLLIASIIVFLGELNYSGQIRRFPNLIRIDSPIHYLLGPVTYFYVLSSLKKDLKFRYIHLLNLLPFLINLAQFMPFYLSDTTFKLEYYNEFMQRGSVVMQKQYLLKAISIWAYFAAQVYLVLRFYFKNKKSRQINRYMYSWFFVFLGGQLISYLGVAYDHLTGLQTFSDPYRFSMHMVSFLLISTTVALLFYPHLLYGYIFNTKSQSDKYVHSGLSEDKKGIILAGLNVYIKSKDKPYLNPKLTISYVANHLDSSPQYLSQVINEKTGTNFNDYVNSLRVEEAKRLLQSNDFKKLTIDAIALKSGFNSKSPFYAAFKKHTGMTPKQFVSIESNG